MEKIKKFIIANSKEIILGIVIIVMASFLCVHAADNVFEYSNVKYENEEVLDMAAGTVVKQNIQMPEKNGSSLAVKFATYASQAKGNLEVQLLENGTVVKIWTVETSSLTDNDYHKLSIKKIDFKEDSVYELQIVSDSTAENIALYITEDSGGENFCSVNGEDINNKAICYKYYYPNSSGIALIVVLFVILAGLFVVRYFKMPKSYVMMMLLTIVGIVYFVIIPLGEVPDENGHFYRAFEVSCGSAISDYTPSGGGAYLPSALIQYKDDTARIDWNDCKELAYPNTALYAAVSYFPQAIGIRIARFFTDNVSMIFYAGRMGNFIASLLLSIWALKKIPFAKEVLFVIMMFPMTLQEMISMAPDGFTNALSFAFVSYVLYLAYESEKITKRDIILLTIMGITISLCKIVYVVEILLLFILPAKKLGGKKKSLCFKMGIPGIALILNLIWLKISSGFLVEFNPGVDTGKQVIYILTHLNEYYAVVVRTITEKADVWIRWLFGEALGTLSIPITGMVWISFLILLMYVMFCANTNKLRLRRSDIACYWMVFLGGCALIAASLYVQWTPYKANMISGIQGRYFIPLLIFLLLPVVYRKKLVTEEDNEEEISYPYYIVVFLEGMALIDILRYFIN